MADILPKMNHSSVEDHYEIGDQLGAFDFDVLSPLSLLTKYSGAYSVVVRATEKETGRDWAIKIVRLSLLSRPHPSRRSTRRPPSSVR